MEPDNTQDILRDLFDRVAAFRRTQADDYRLDLARRLRIIGTELELSGAHQFGEIATELAGLVERWAQ
jgi:hypothetical protein